MIQTISLLPGVTLRCFPDERFKCSSISVQLVRPMDRQEAALNALIPAVLLRGCVGYEDLRSITLRLDELYGAAVGTMVRRVGDWQTTGLACSFIDDRYALAGDSVLAPMLAFLGRLLLEPVTQKGVFCKDYVSGEKRNLIQTLEAQRNDKRAYAMEQLFAHMCTGDSFGIPRLGEISQVRSITPQSAWAHYRRILAESPIEIFYVGSAAPETVASLLRPIFQRIDRTPAALPAQTAFCGGAGGSHTHTLDVSQGKLCMGFVTPHTLRCPEFAAMQVLNTVFGAGMTCKLFMQVREKQSLCYDIGSTYHGSKGILTVCAGIDSDKDEQVRSQVMTQLQACCEGDITDAELASAKSALISQLRTTHDSPSAIENYYATAALSGLEMTPQQYIHAVRQVTVGQVIEAARSLQLHTVYFLKGVR